MGGMGGMGSMGGGGGGLGGMESSSSFIPQIPHASKASSSSKRGGGNSMGNSKAAQANFVIGGVGLNASFRGGGVDRFDVGGGLGSGFEEKSYGTDTVGGSYGGTSNYTGHSSHGGYSRHNHSSSHSSHGYNYGGKAASGYYQPSGYKSQKAAPPHKVGG